MRHRNTVTERGDHLNMVETSTLTLAASSLIFDPKDSTERVERIIDQLRQRNQSEQHLSDQSLSELIRAVEQLRHLRADTLSLLYENAKKKIATGSESEQNAALVLIGTLRAVLTRRLVQGTPLTAEEERIYEKIRVHR